MKNYVFILALMVAGVMSVGDRQQNKLLTVSVTDTNGTIERK
jgi:hypothetical protein